MNFVWTLGLELWNSRKCQYRSVRILPTLKLRRDKSALISLVIMEEKKFQRSKEDFVCEHCGAYVHGNGYTDHCPYCLWSKHVDINPGDRKSKCGGLMKPIAAEPKGDGYLIYYQCLKCGRISRVKSAPNDNFEEILKLVHNPIPADFK